MISSYFYIFIYAIHAVHLRMIKFNHQFLKLCYDIIIYTYDKITDNEQNYLIYAIFNNFLYHYLAFSLPIKKLI